ncbi:class I SAM-dependent methyltransferase [Candidatus Pelagibacter sp.]|nr:class I SAM-dependent methyltransferase [Candidatus Pelagibacter sp.]
MEKVRVLSSIKKILNYLAKPADFFLLIALIPSSFVMLLYRKIGSHKMTLSTYLLKKIGIFPIIKNYYEPQFDFDNLKSDLKKKRNLPGVNLNTENQLNLLKKFEYKQELIDLNLDSRNPNINFNIDNNFFERGDAEIYYQVIRFFKPKKIVEIGSGQSTLIALEAIKKNKLENNYSTELICVEPYENNWLENLGIEIMRKKIEDVDLDLCKRLEANDILFIDSSHIIRPQGDILKEFLEILPLLKPGVIIHIHDIYTPRNYPERWLKKENRFYNEQYLLEAMLDNSKRYSVLLALNFLKNDHFDKLKICCPYLKEDTEPGSFYLRVN